MSAKRGFLADGNPRGKLEISQDAVSGFLVTNPIRRRGTVLSTAFLIEEPIARPEESGPRPPCEACGFLASITACIRCGKPFCKDCRRSHLCRPRGRGQQRLPM